MTIDDIKEECFQLREEMLVIANRLDLIRNPDSFVSYPYEINANLTLAYRHLEDCRMRLGKAVQAIDGGTSVYPR